MFGSILCWEGELVCFAIFRLLCNYAREGVSKHRGLDHHQPVEKLNSVRYSPEKMLNLLNKLITPLREEIPLMQRCEADDDPRAIDSLFDISGPNYKMSRSKRRSL